MARGVKTRTLSGRSLVHALEGNEKPHPVYRFSRRDFFERPRHNPFEGLGPGMLASGNIGLMFSGNSIVEHSQ